MISLLRGACGAITFAVLLGTFAAPSVRAQDAPAPVAAPDVQTRTFQIRNVKPSLVAFWLDPAHHAAPIEVQMGQGLIAGNDLNPDFFPMVVPEGEVSHFPDFPKLPRLPGNANGPRDLHLPQGITSIVAVDPQISLFVTGTANGLSALEKLLPTLDVALVQYEVEARFYQLDRATLPQTGLKFQRHQEENADNFGSATALPLDFEQRIEKLIESKRALLLTAPRVTLLDGLGAQLKQSTSTPILWNETPALSHPVGVSTNRKTPQRIAYIRISIGINTSVTRIENGLIALAVEPRFGTRTLSVQATMREDQPFAIQFSPSTDKRQIIVIVTPRRVRRAGDDA